MLKEIYRSVDKYGAIQVLDDGAKRYLAFGNDHEQSCQIKASPHIPQHEYSRAIMMVLLFCKPQSVCILGLGGGTSALAFMNALPQGKISAVELRPEVVKIAHHYFKVPKHPALVIHEKDAKDFLQGNSQLFNVLVADIYHHHGIDEYQLQTDFITRCAASISDDGWLVLNYWLDHDLPEALLAQLEKHFEQLFVCNSGGGNWIIYAGKVAADSDYLNKERVKPLAKTLGYSLNYYLKRLKVLTIS